MQVSSGLFDRVYHAVYDDVSGYTAEAIATCLQNGGLDFQQGFTLEEAWSGLRCLPDFQLHVEWALFFLRQQGYLVQRGGCWLGAQRKRYAFGDGRNVQIQPSLNLIDYVAAHWLDVIQGRSNSLHVLFGPEGAPLWEHYFSNSHDLYAVHNQWAAECLADRMKADQAQAPEVLELGTGYGSASMALLAECMLRAQPVGRCVLTDISAALANRARKRLAASYPAARLDAGKLDLNADYPDWAEAFDYIFAVNVAHCAQDIVAALNRLRSCLKPGGTLLLSECMRQDHTRLLHQEFIFSLLPNFAPIRRGDSDAPCFGFWSGADWHAFMESAGYRSIQVIENEGRQILGGLIIGS
ncbi:class I SAM-dependent methyltransferase [Xylanibacillus composti]|nr:class I SAM-dependent methyltransferase [Xylanibacillus composti]